MCANDRVGSVDSDARPWSSLRPPHLPERSARPWPCAGNRRSPSASRPRCSWRARPPGSPEPCSRSAARRPRSRRTGERRWALALGPGRPALGPLPPADPGRPCARLHLRPRLLAAGAPRRLLRPAPALLRARYRRHGARLRRRQRHPLPGRLGGDGARRLPPRPHRAREAGGAARRLRLPRRRPRREPGPLRALRPARAARRLLRVRRHGRPAWTARAPRQPGSSRSPSSASASRPASCRSTSGSPGAHAAAPSHVSAVMSGVLLKTGIYGLLRVTGFFDAPPPRVGRARSSRRAPSPPSSASASRWRSTT